MRLAGASPPPPSGPRALLDAGQYAAAEETARAELGRREAAGEGESPAAAAALDVLVEALSRGKQALAPETRRLGQRAVELRTRLHGAEHPDTARSVGNLGFLHFANGDYEPALALYRRALEIRERTLGAGHPDVAASLNQLAPLRQTLGDYDAARPLYERALEIREKTAGPDHPETAKVLNNLATLLKDTGDWAGARPLYERSLAILRRALPDHPLVAVALNNLADLRQRMGDRAEAAALYGEALALKERTLGPDHPSTAISLNNLAYLELEQGQFDRARPRLERAVAIFERSAAASTADLARSLNNLGEALFRQGDLAGARRNYRRSLELRAQALGAEHPDVAYSLANLAELELAAGAPAQARQEFERALRLRETGLGGAHPLVAESLDGLAAALAATGERARAIEAALRAEEVAREHLRLTARGSSERQALQYAAQRPAALDRALGLLAESPDGGNVAWRRQAWESLIRSRALVLDEMAQRHRDARRAEDAPTRALRRSAQDAARRLAQLVLRGPAGLPADRYQRLGQDARAAKDRAEQALAARSSSYRSARAQEQAGLREVAAALPAGSALVAYARYAPAAPAAAAPAYLAFVLRPGLPEPLVVSLGCAQEIEDRVRRWRQEVAAGLRFPGRPPRAAEAASRSAGVALRQAIWDPVAAHLGAERRVFVVPAGALHLVSLAALPAPPDDGARYLVENELLFHRLSAEREVVALASRDPAGRGLLAVGGPDFERAASWSERAGRALEAGAEAVAALLPLRGASVSCADFVDLRFAPLPAAGREAQEVARLWRRTASEPWEERSGPRATEEAVKQLAPGRRVLHLATHAFLVGDGCRGDAFGSPLLFSGLALAGANRRAAAPSQGEDGVLTAEEIATMPLEGLEWAVLSGCDTGGGEIQAGEGVLGLERAFRLAGARTLVMSLWPVSDAASRAWMEALYRARLEEGRSTAEAVRAAQLAVLAAERARGASGHPFPWAGFVASGDWR